MHEAMAARSTPRSTEIRRIQRAGTGDGRHERPRWPMIVLASPKGWTGPKEVDGLADRRHLPRAPGADLRSGDASRPPEAARGLAASYRADELFDDAGRLRPTRRARAAARRAHGREPARQRRPAAARPALPDFRDYACDVPAPGAPGIGDTRVLGPLPARRRSRSTRRSATSASSAPTRPCRTASRPCSRPPSGNGTRRTVAGDEFLAPTGRVMEMLSEHQCEGWLEGYLLTGRHGLFNCYEAFIHIVDSMFNQHAKWLKVTASCRGGARSPRSTTCSPRTSGARTTTASRTRIPGFIDHVVNKKAEIVRVYLPPDANCLLSVMDHCLRSRHYVNVVVAGKHPAPQWLAMDAAAAHCAEGIGIWDWASNDQAERARRRHGLLRRRADARDAGRGVDPARAPARAEGPRRQRRRPDEAAAADRASARPERRRLRRDFHRRQAGDLRLPRLSRR